MLYICVYVQVCGDYGLLFSKDIINYASLLHTRMARKKIAHYKSFRVGGPEEKYKLQAYLYAGNAGKMFSV